MANKKENDRGHDHREYLTIIIDNTMYDSDFISFSFEGYRMRNTLAVLDYNHHLGRPQAKDAKGNPRLVNLSHHA